MARQRAGGSRQRPGSDQVNRDTDRRAGRRPATTPADRELEEAADDADSDGDPFGGGRTGSEAIAEGDSTRARATGSSSGSDDATATPDPTRPDRGGGSTRPLRSRPRTAGAPGTGRSGNFRPGTTGTEALARGGDTRRTGATARPDADRPEQFGEVNFSGGERDTLEAGIERRERGFRERVPGLFGVLAASSPLAVGGGGGGPPEGSARARAGAGVRRGLGDAANLYGYANTAEEAAEFAVTQPQRAIVDPRRPLDEERQAQQEFGADVERRVRRTATGLAQAARERPVETGATLATGVLAGAVGGSALATGTRRLASSGLRAARDVDASTARRLAGERGGTARQRLAEFADDDRGQADLAGPRPRSEGDSDAGSVSNEGVTGEDPTGTFGTRGRAQGTRRTDPTGPEIRERGPRSLSREQAFGQRARRAERVPGEDLRQVDREARALEGRIRDRFGDDPQRSGELLDEQGQVRQRSLTRGAEETGLSREAAAAGALARSEQAEQQTVSTTGARLRVDADGRLSERSRSRSRTDTLTDQDTGVGSRSDLTTRTGTTTGATPRTEVPGVPDVGTPDQTTQTTQTTTVPGTPGLGAPGRPPAPRTPGLPGLGGSSGPDFDGPGGYATDETFGTGFATGSDVLDTVATDGATRTRQALADLDGDGVPNYRDRDADGDGILDRYDPVISLGP